MGTEHTEHAQLGETSARDWLAGVLQRPISDEEVARYRQFPLRDWRGNDRRAAVELIKRGQDPTPAARKRMAERLKADRQRRLWSSMGDGGHELQVRRIGDLVVAELRRRDTDGVGAPSWSELFDAIAPLRDVARRDRIVVLQALRSAGFVRFGDDERSIRAVAGRNQAEQDRAVS